MIITVESVSRVAALLRPREVAGAIAGWSVAVLDLVLPAGTASRAADAIRLRELIHMTLSTAIFLAGLFAVIFLLEYFAGSARSRYRSRVFVQDALYTLFYHGGFYNLLIWAGLANAFSEPLAFLRVDALAALPPPVHWLLYWTFSDLLYYWLHRWQHSWGPLWAIHSMHHSQEEMTFASTFRFHPLDQFANSLLGVLALVILGVPTVAWLPLYVALQLFDAVQHSSLDWSYGRAYRLFVSPRFHAIHHSAESRHHDRNFAKIFSGWDFLFGTAVVEPHRPSRLGVDGLPVPRTILEQLLSPFRILAASRGRKPGEASLGSRSTR